jgi:effector-binding domain-containing protein
MYKIKIEKTKPMKLAYIEHIGEYSKIPFDKYVPRLYEWAKENRVRPGFKNVNVYHDDPQEKNPAECKTWVGIPVSGEARSDNEVTIEDLPALEIASLKFKGTPDEIKNAYEEIGEWLNENGYEWNGPSREVCSKKPKEKDGKMILFSTIQVPIKKK